MRKGNMEITPKDLETESPPATERLTIERAWRAASDEAELALGWWNDASATRRADAYAVYVAAADREAAALEHLGQASAP
ncbi:hypothetical protein OJ998_00890 [Solirubrobacter taibaiensis]|nr:hypothetical protein [Solirubrobacter taibaiensis]